MTGPIMSDAKGRRLVAIVTGGDGLLNMGPFDRPNLRPWLTDPEKLTEYDGFIVYHLNLLTRHPGELVEFIRWCDAHGKTLISVKQDFQLDTPAGRKIADTLAEIVDAKTLLVDDDRAHEVAEILKGIVDLDSIEIPD